MFSSNSRRARRTWHINCKLGLWIGLGVSLKPSGFRPSTMNVKVIMTIKQKKFSPSYNSRMRLISAGHLRLSSQHAFLVVNSPWKIITKKVWNFLPLWEQIPPLWLATQKMKVHLSSGPNFWGSFLSIQVCLTYIVERSCIAKAGYRLKPTWCILPLTSPYHCTFA